MAKLIIGVLLLFFLILVILFFLIVSFDVFKKGEEGRGFESRGRRDIERRVL